MEKDEKREGGMLRNINTKIATKMELEDAGTRVGFFLGVLAYFAYFEVVANLHEFLQPLVEVCLVT